MCGLGRERRGVVGRPPHRRLKLLLEAGIEDQSDRWTCTLSAERNAPRRSRIESLEA